MSCSKIILGLLSFERYPRDPCKNCGKTTASNLEYWKTMVASTNHISRFTNFEFLRKAIIHLQLIYYILSENKGFSCNMYNLIHSINATI